MLTPTTTTTDPASPTYRTASPQAPASYPSPHDKGFVSRGYHRQLVGNEWETVPDEHGAPEDIYGDAETFMESSATVQIVTFYMGEDNCQQAKWQNPLTSPQDVKEALKKEQEANTWRWVHCEGLHGPTMKAIAEATDWSLDKFAGIFARTRASSEWMDGCLLVHFRDQLTSIWMLYKEYTINPVFVTCTKLECDPGLKKRWEDFIDFGDSRRSLLLRKDPSLMLYGILRAIIQDLRATAFTTPKDLHALYDIATARPSKKSLSYFYGLQQSLIRVKLDTTSLRDAASSLVTSVDAMHRHARERRIKPLVSQETQLRLKDQLGLIRLLFNELPEATRELDVVASLAFNILAFSNNNLLRALAVLSVTSVPLSMTCSILAITPVSHGLAPEIIAVIIFSVGLAAILGMGIFLVWDRIKSWQLRRGRNGQQKNARILGIHSIRELEERFADQEERNLRSLFQTTKMDSKRPDVYASVVPDSGPTPFVTDQPSNMGRRGTIVFGLSRQPEWPSSSGDTLI